MEICSSIVYVPAHPPGAMRVFLSVGTLVTHCIPLSLGWLPDDSLVDCTENLFNFIANLSGEGG